jgi:hypothetical protein
MKFSELQIGDECFDIPSEFGEVYRKIIERKSNGHNAICIEGPTDTIGDTCRIDPDDEVERVE